MEVRDLIKKYLGEPRVMQVATTSSDQPWICTVHFAFDDNLSLYWISSSESRHSKELTANGNVAITIPIKFPEHPVIGVSVEGDSEALENGSLKEALDFYDQRFNISEGFKSKLLAGEGKYKLYRIKPRLFVLFDEKEFPDNPRQEWIPERTRE